MIENKPSIYNGNGVYNGGGGGGGGGTPDGYKFYSKIVFNGTTGFSSVNLKAVVNNVVADDVIYFDYAFNPSVGSGNSYLFDFNLQEVNGGSYFRRCGHVKRNSNTHYHFINNTSESAYNWNVSNTLVDVAIKQTKTGATFNGGDQVNVTIGNYVYGLLSLGPWNSPCAIYSFRVFDSSETTLKYDLIPALQIDTGKKGIYDKVSNTFIEADDQTSNTVLFGLIDV